MSDEENKQEHHSGFWLGMIAGGLMGAVAAYLTVADEKDKKKLIAKGKEILETLEDFGKGAAEKGKELGETVWERVEELPQKIEPVVKEVKKPAKKFFFRKRK